MRPAAAAAVAVARGESDLAEWLLCVRPFRSVLWRPSLLVDEVELRWSEGTRCGGGGGEWLLRRKDESLLRCDFSGERERFLSFLLLLLALLPDER